MKKALVYILVACVIFALQPSVLAADAEMQVCTDPMSGTQITVPSTWPTEFKETSDKCTWISWDRKVGDDYSFISYFCNDVSEKFTQIKGPGYAREDMDGSALTTDELVDFFGIYILSGSVFDTYNGIEYYCEFSYWNNKQLKHAPFRDERSDASSPRSAIWQPYSEDEGNIGLYCIVDGYSYSFSLTGYHGNGIFEAFEQMVGTVRFGGKDGYCVADSGRWYTIPSSGSTFMLPDGLEQVEDDRFGEIWGAVLAPQDNESARILVSCVDFYSELPRYIRQDYSRLDSDALETISDEADFAEFYGAPVESVGKRWYNGVEYYELSCAMEELDHEGDFYSRYSAYGFEQIKVVHGMFNGYLYVFAYLGDAAGTGVAQYTDMVKTVHHDRIGALKASVEWTPLLAADTETGSERTDTWAAIISVLLFIVRAVVNNGIYFVPLVIYRYVVKKAPVSKEKAKEVTTAYGAGLFILLLVISTTTRALVVPALCRWLGVKLLTGGKDRRKKYGGEVDVA